MSAVAPAHPRAIDLFRGGTACGGEETKSLGLDTVI